MIRVLGRGPRSRGRLALSLMAGPVLGVATVALAISGAPASGGVVPAVASTRSGQVAGTWGTPLQLPGTRPQTAVLSLSCSAPGDCGAGGTGFTDSEKNGKWGTASPVPGTGGLGVQWSVSCTSPGNCGAAGNRSDAVYVATEKDGTWGRAEKVPGLRALGLRGNAVINALSCGGAGSCVAGGSYEDGSHHTQAFVVTAKGGAWTVAQQLPGLVALNKGGYSSLSAVSCASAGNCTGGGLYTDRKGAQQAFVISQAGYKWHLAANLPGLPARNKGAYALVSAVSCPSPGNCGAGGIYTDGGFNNTAFVVSRSHRTWKSSLRLAGVNGLSAGPSVGIDQISCSSAGNCGAGGFYTDAGGRQQAFVASEVNGKWSAGEAVPGTVTANTGFSALTASVSCRSKGNCTAGGLFTLVSGHSVVFVVSEVSGMWGPAEDITGVGNYETLYSVSCAAPANCVAGLGAMPGFPGKSYVLAETPGH
jgi:hypothetical protein